PGDEISWRIRGACGTNGTSWATIFTQPVTFTLGGARLENSSVANLDVYPNPSRSEFTISFNLERRQDVYLTITNYLGEDVFIEKLKDQEGQCKKTIQLGDKANGIYMMNITTNSQNINQKIVIQ
ncbi:MAG: T9SS type A sorting domain-containing protein, partial [Flavobacteriales bacterium]